MYRGGRPNRLAGIMNRGWALVGRAGLWRNRVVTLEVRGRRSGRVVSFPLVMATYAGERYLVPMLGERANWVANVRAAAGQAVLVRGGREQVRLEEVDPSNRAPILR
ncbi:MAG TPA: nitroreductase/quinone reductase family protein, partial [Nocardioides sp.]